MLRVEHDEHPLVELRKEPAQCVLQIDLAPIVVLLKVLEIRKWFFLNDKIIKRGKCCEINFFKQLKKHYKNLFFFVPIITVPIHMSNSTTFFCRKLIFVISKFPFSSP